MKLKPTKNLKIYIIGGLILVLIAVSILVRQAVVFRVTSTSPKLPDVTTFAPYVKISFNHTLDAKKVSVDKASFITSYSVDKNVITVKVNNLGSGQKYTIHVATATDTSGKVLKNLTFSFTAAAGDWDKLSKKDQQTILDEQAKKVPSVSDPVMQYVPYSTLDYIINPVAVGDGNAPLTLHIQLLMAPNTPLDQQPAILAQYKQEASDYLKSKNIDITKYQVTYEQVDEQLNGR